MKILKSRLQQIIKEEYLRLMTEGIRVEKKFAALVSSLEEDPDITEEYFTAKDPFIEISVPAGKYVYSMEDDGRVLEQWHDGRNGHQPEMDVYYHNTDQAFQSVKTHVTNAQSKTLRAYFNGK